MQYCLNITKLGVSKVSAFFFKKKVLSFGGFVYNVTKIFSIYLAIYQLTYTIIDQLQFGLSLKMFNLLLINESRKKNSSNLIYKNTTTDILCKSVFKIKINNENDSCSFNYKAVS